MKLSKFRIRNFRSVLDSDWVSVADVTAIVGKNEAGKTSLLKALHLLNPGSSSALDIKRDWPRSRRQAQDPKAIIVEALFLFDEAERVELAKTLTLKAAPEGASVSLSYDGTKKCHPVPQECLSAGSLPDDLKSALAAESSFPAIKKIASTIRTAVADYSENGDLVKFKSALSKQRVALSSLPRANPPLASESTRLKNLLDQILLKFAVKTVDSFEAFFFDRLPIFVFWDDHSPFMGVAYLDQIQAKKQAGALTLEDQTFLMLLELAELNLETEMIRIKSDDREQRMLDMQDASVRLTEKLSGHWSQRRNRILLQADGNQLIAFVSDDVEAALVPLDQRSRGFQWFFSFDAKLLHDTKGQLRHAIILLDEPGLHLHASAQNDLLQRLREYSSDCQIIYSTHMPFLLDIERLQNVRICYQEKDKGTSVTENLGAACHDSLLPLQAALGLQLSQSLFIGQKNLVVEGISDLWFLYAMWEVMRDAGKVKGSEAIVITPCGGASKVPPMATIYASQGLSTVVLLDSDKEGNEAKELLLKKRLISGKRILQISDFLGAGIAEVTIEDALDKEFYIDSVNRVYAKELGKHRVEVSELAATPNIAIVKNLESILRERGMAADSTGHCFNKTRVARDLYPRIQAMNTSSFSKETLKFFDGLHTKVQNGF
jgi:predicted ATP-dependent endonuclease of OLD family